MSESDSEPAFSRLQCERDFISHSSAACGSAGAGVVDSLDILSPSAAAAAKGYDLAKGRVRTWHTHLYLDCIAGPGVEFFQIIFYIDKAAGSTATAGVPQSRRATSAAAHSQN
jgi:hypothetical protein